MNLPIMQRVSDGELFEDFFTWVVEEEEEKKDRFLEDVNHDAIKADYGAIPQREGDRASLTQGEAEPWGLDLWPETYDLRPLTCDLEALTPNIVTSWFSLKLSQFADWETSELQIPSILP